MNDAMYIIVIQGNRVFKVTLYLRPQTFASDGTALILHLLHHLYISRDIPSSPHSSRFPIDTVDDH